MFAFIKLFMDLTGFDTTHLFTSLKLPNEAIYSLHFLLFLYVLKKCCSWTYIMNSLYLRIIYSLICIAGLKNGVPFSSEVIFFF